MDYGRFTGTLSVRARPEARKDCNRVNPGHAVPNRMPYSEVDPQRALRAWPNRLIPETQQPLASVRGTAFFSQQRALAACTPGTT